MTGRTRIAAVGAGALLALGFLTAAPAGASDGAHADATVAAETADVVSQTLDLVNQACVDATRVTGAATSTRVSGNGITVASRQSGTGLNLAVSLPALTQSLPVLGSLPVVGSVSGQADAAPLNINCTTSGNGTGIGLSAAGVDALVNAIAPGLDVSGLDLSGVVPTADAAASTSATVNAPATSATAGAAAPAASLRAAAQSPSVQAGAAAQPRTATATVTATPASSSTGILGQTVGSPGALARTGAGVGALGLLGTALFGSGRLLALGRKLLRHAG
jgi:hypothetical protein